MEEKQKKTRTVTKSDKNNKASKEETVAKKPTTRKSTGTKKETKAPKEETAKKETKPAKAVKADSVKTTTKKATTSNEKGETKTSKARTAKKETSTSKTNVAKKNTTKTNSTKKVASTSKNKSVEEITNREEPKLTIIHEKKEQPLESKDYALKKEPKQEKVSTSKKKSKQEDSSTPKKEKKTKKAKKNYIDISVGAIICAAIIVGLILVNVKLGTHAYNVITKNELANSKTETDNDISVTQEVGNVLSNSDDLVEEMKKRITFAPNVTASIYDAETFSTNTISNDLKLILGWSMTEDNKKLKSRNENDQEIEAIEKETMAENIKNILGSDIKYKDKTFNNTNNSTFSVYSPNQGTISYSNGIYTSIVSENADTEIAPLIYQEIQKVVRYTDKVVVYVKVAYMDVEEDKYIAYKDFNDEKFEEKLLEITAEELFGEEVFNQYTGEGTVTINANSSLDGIRNELDTYKYTFSLDKETEDYYLTKFNKALSMQ